MSAAMVLLAGALAAGGQVVEVAFLPNQPELPPLVVRVEQQGSARSVAWVVAAEQPASGLLSDRKGSGRSLLALPEPPTGAALHDDGAVLALTIDDAGDWARRYLATSGAGRARIAGVSVAGARALRLVVPALGAAPGPATLVGATARVAGMGVATGRAFASRALVRVGAELLVAEPTAIDGSSACGAVLAASWSAERPALRLLAAGTPVCVGTMAVARVSGVRVGPRLDQPVAGVVIAAAP